MATFKTRLFKNSWAEEEGAAMTEFAIMIPALMIIFFYSVFFTDLVEVKLKTLEAARYATWEATVYRDPATVNQEIKRRFANLKSTDEADASTMHMIGITLKDVQPTLDDQLVVDMTGGVPDSDHGNGSSDASLGGLDKTINTVLGWARLPTKGKARGEVTFVIENKIVPDFMMLGTQVRAQDNESDGFSSGNGFTIKSHNVLIYDTWRGWPNKNRLVGNRNGAGTSPMQSYPVAEQAMVDQLRHIAFAKLNSFSLVNKLGKVFTFFGLPNPIAYQSEPGPTSMKAPETLTNIRSFSPTRAESASFRFGQRWGRRNFLADTPNTGIDHSRWTLPYSISTGRYGGRTITWWHQKAGGMISLSRPWSMWEYPNNTKLNSWQTQNDYFLSYGCRGHFYDGMITEDGAPGDYRNYKGCGDKADKVQKGAQSLLDRFGGGLQLPGF